MGSTSFYPDEAPVHTATVGAFAVERHPVTNAQFAEFVADTGYVTVAERPLDPALYPGVAPADLAPGALVFRPTAGPVDLRDWRQWWDWAPGASWRQPFGAGSADWDFAGPAWTIRWCRSPIPTRRPMRSGRGGGCPPRRSGSTRRAAAAPPPTRGATTSAPGGELMANTWQGRFPYRNDGALGWVGTSPVGTFPPNGFGLRRHDRQRLGVDDDRVQRPPPGGCARERAAARRRGSPIRPSTRPSRADRICAPRSTATGTGPRPGRRSRRTVRPRTSASAASRDSGALTPLSARPRAGRHRFGASPLVT